MSALARFRKKYPHLAPLPASEVDGSLKLGDDMTITGDQRGWTLYLPEAHGHYDSLDKSLEAARDILHGMMCTIQEFRGDVLAQTWFATCDDYEYIGVEHLAVYLDPFDAEEWTTWHGELWKQVRTVRRFEDGGEVTLTTTQDHSYEPLANSRSMANWLSDGLGPAQPGMRWIVAGHTRFVLQAPVGWRKVPSDSSAGHADFTPEQEGFAFRAIAYFRDSEPPHPAIEKAATRPRSIDEVDGEEAPGWQQYSWNLIFSDGENDMLGVIYLYFQPDLAEEAETYRRRIEASLPHCLMAPAEWDCKTIA